MSNTRRCTHCGQKIETEQKPDENWVACEHCGQKMYLAQPDNVEEIPIAPVDEEEERRAEQRRARDRAIADQALEGNYTPEAPSTPSQPTPAPQPSAGASSDKLTDRLAQYVLWMSQGEMARCDDVVSSLLGQRKKAHAAAQELLKELPKRSDLNDVPPAVVKGYLKQLLAQL